MVDVDRMQTKPTGTPLSQLAERMWDVWGDSSTTVFEGRRWTTAELGARARAFAGGLRDLGVASGDRVVVCMANCPEVTISYHAIWRIGAVPTPVLFLLSEDELRHVLIDSEAVAVITTPEFLPKVSAAAQGIRTVKEVILAGPPVDGTHDFAELAAGDEADLVDTRSSDLAALLYTGGTTGQSKGVMLDHDALSAAAWAANVSGTETGFTTSILPLPLAHVFGLMVSTMALHATEPTTAVLMRWFEPSQYLALIQSERVQIGGVVPAMLRALLAQPLEDYDLSSLRRLSSGSAPLAEDVVAQLHDRLPNVEIGDGYGCTETAALVSGTPYGKVRPGSVGLAQHGVEIRIVGLDGRPVLAGEDGEICVRGPMLLRGYWRSPEATDEAVREGWFHTGDVGRLDADGYLYIVDRIKDLIIRGGFNVYPRDVEEVLMAHPGVVNAAVIGRPDERNGEEVVAFVQPPPGGTLDADEVRAYAKSHLSAVKYPREVYVVEQIPLTSVGKLDKVRLRAQLEV